MKRRIGIKEFSNIEWNPIRVENGEYIGNLPNIDENNGNREFLVTYESISKHRSTDTDVWNDTYNRFRTFNVMSNDTGYGIVAWANFPEHYKGE
jgi:hypothetical protein